MECTSRRGQCSSSDHAHPCLHLHRHGEDRDGSLGNVQTPEGVGKYVEYAIEMIEMIRYFCLITMYGCILMVMVGVHRMMPETVPPYSDEGSIVPEQEAGRVKDDDDAIDCVKRQCSRQHLKKSLAQWVLRPRGAS